MKKKKGTAVEHITKRRLNIARREAQWREARPYCNCQEAVVVWATGTITASGLSPLMPDAALDPLFGVPGPHAPDHLSRPSGGAQDEDGGVQGRAPGDNAPGYLGATGGTVVGGGTLRGHGLAACWAFG